MATPKPTQTELPATTGELTTIDIEQIILMAWGDTIPFESIEREYGLTEGAVKKLMRAHQSEKTYRRWRERVTARRGPSSKHKQLTRKTSARQKY
ncbi:MAG TPA: TIGR03643 family protein [Candidatus Paceibacterota bacterium]|nr:TIGR03643 family protein [Candidatus Paceibacterota bacterium]